MTAPKYTRPAGSQSAVAYKCNIDAMAKIMERRLAGFSVHEQDQGSPAPDMTVRVMEGHAHGTALTEVAAQTVSGFTTPSAGQARVDRVVYDPWTGAAVRVAGTPATGSPSAAPPEIAVPYYPLARVAFTDSDTVITNAMITDERTFIDRNLVDGARFDGTFDFGLRGGQLTGLVDGKKGTISLWFKRETSSGVLAQRFIGNSGFSCYIDSAAGGVITVVAVNAAGSIILDLKSTITYPAGSPTPGWNHLLASWDLSDPDSNKRAWMAVNGVDVTNSVTETDDTIDYDRATDWAVGAFLSAEKFGGGMAELWLDSTSHLDKDDMQTAVRLFRRPDGRPEWLGSDGSRVTGTAPIVYLRLDDAGTPENFYVNRGTGGSFTSGGSPNQLDTTATSPSD